jgi:hypothetical protein
VFFYGDLRTSTLIAALAFVALSLIRRDRVPLVACVAWLLGFEAAFSVATAAFFRPNVFGPLALMIAVGITTYLIGARERDRTYLRLALLLGCWIGWIAVSVALHTSPKASAFAAAIFYAGLVATVLPRFDVRPSPPLLLAAVAVFLVWCATGFHVNAHAKVGFDPSAEALNEAAKTLWALAYLLPLWRSSHGPSLKLRQPIRVDIAAGSDAHS